AVRPVARLRGVLTSSQTPARLGKPESRSETVKKFDPGRNFVFNTRQERHRLWYWSFDHSHSEGVCSMADPTDITQLLAQWSSGDDKAGDRIAPIVSYELLAISRRLLRSERASHTLKPTALVNEAFERLMKVDVDWQDRAHFFALSARLMRRILINYAEQRAAAKRGGGQIMVTLSPDQEAIEDTDASLLDLNQAIEELAKYDERKAKLIEMQYFGGMAVAEMAKVLDTSQSTVTRDLRFARAWLKDYLSQNS
ncbi:MAG: ECF-type sigma factor, partial [Pseudomonadota bacterium]